MSKKTADVQPGARSTGSFPFRRQTATRRPPTSARLAREARQQQLAFIALFVVVALVVITLAAGAIWQYVLYPAQPVATVNGKAIRTDTFQRYQKFESFLLGNQAAQLQAQIFSLQQQSSNKKNAALNQQLISQLQSQLQTIQYNQQSNLQAYTLQQMEQSIELRQAAQKLGQAPTPKQIDDELAKIRKQAGTATFNRILATGVTLDDLRTYYLTPIVVQTNVTNYFAARVKVSPTQPQAQARHILVKDKKRADLLAQSIRQGANFAALAKKYSTDTGSASSGGVLTDPSTGVWITPNTSFVKPVLDAILSMKPGEVKVVKSQFGYHVIQVTQRRIQHFTKKELDAQRQQQAQQQFQNWETTATDATKNKVSPPDPSVQFPPTTPTGQ